MAVTATLVVMACGPKFADQAPGAGPTAAAPTRLVTASGSPQSVQATASPPPGTTAYTSDKWLYTIYYPSSWYHIPNAGAPDNDSYFASKQVSLPMLVGDDGIWITIQVNGDLSGGCSPGAGAPTPTPVSFGGMSAGLNSSPDSGGELWLVYKGWCYRFAYVVHSANANTRFAPDVATMMKTFKYNR